jgi:hypothetical protein
MDFKTKKSFPTQKKWLVPMDFFENKVYKDGRWDLFFGNIGFVVSNKK